MKISDEEFKKRLNLNVVELLDNTTTCGWLDIPKMYCPNINDIDFLALYTEPGMYEKMPKTAVCFYNYDIKFDNINGLFNAIYYKNEKPVDYIDSTNQILTGDKFVQLMDKWEVNK